MNFPQSDKSTIFKMRVVLATFNRILLQELLEISKTKSIRKDSKQDTRLLPGYFRSPIFLKILFIRMAALFLASHFLTFRNLFFLLNLNLVGKKTFQRIISFDTLSAANLPPLPILKIFF